MANFGQFLAKMGKTGFYFKKVLGTFFSRLQALTNWNVSEKVMNGFQATTWRKDALTDVRTNGRESLGLQRLRRETKNQTIPMNKSEEKWENLIFEPF